MLLQNKRSSKVQMRVAEQVHSILITNATRTPFRFENVIYPNKYENRIASSIRQPFLDPPSPPIM